MVKIFIRRSLSVTALSLLFVLQSMLAPILLIGALLFDCSRWLTRRPSGVLRLLCMLWFYLAAELVGALVLFASWVVTGFGANSARLTQQTASIQQAWTSSLLWAVQKIYRSPLRVEGQELIQPGPLLLLVRHSSLIDTLLPVVLISKQKNILMRYVLKKELLWDPCLDIAGNRLPNYFVDRKNENRQEEFDGIASLAEGLSPNDGVLIYPEGTRFSPGKLARIQEKLRGTQEGERADRYRCVLPPKLGGVNALLDAAPASDILLMGHYGLEKVSHWASIWRGALTGQPTYVKFWRIPREQVPTDREARKQWLHERWLSIDEWLIEISGVSR